MVFGAITSATDPISVLSIFKEAAVSKKLSTIVEGESLFNDGTAAVLYGILVACVATGTLGIWNGVQEFFVDVLGGVAVGLAMGYLFSKLTEKIDEPRIEITLTTILAYGSYLNAYVADLANMIDSKCQSKHTIDRFNPQPVRLRRCLTRKFSGCQSSPSFCTREGNFGR